MKPLRVGQHAAFAVTVDHPHTADALGNPGVRVAGTAALIVFLEEAAHMCIEPHYEDGETSVGTAIDIRHHAPAPLGAELTISARIVELDGHQARFACEIRSGDQLIIDGHIGRAVVELARFMRRFEAGA